MTQFHIGQLRGEARQIARRGGMKYRAALDHIAQTRGYSHWNGLLNSQVETLALVQPKGPEPSPSAESPHRAPARKGRSSGIRYWRDADFRAAIDRELGLARLETEREAWITYAIHDPQRPDLQLHPDGLRLYVGQTKQFKKRVLQWLRLAGSSTTEPAEQIAGLLYRIMASGSVPRFRVLERTASALDSLVSETNWARQLIKDGYTLANRWEEHRVAGPRIDRYGVPAKRLWELTWEDALVSRIEVVLTCKEIALVQIIKLTDFAPRMRLNEIRRHCLARVRELGHRGTVRLIVR